MKKFSEIADSIRGISEVKEPTGELKSACWKGYTAVGMKMKNGRKVPNCVPVKEDIEQLDEMPGANMDTRAVHSHLKKRGWKLSRTAGSHDVFTHPDAEHHIAVPRHKQLKAPLVKGILKQSEVKELKPHVKGEYGSFAKNIIARRQKGIKMATEQASSSGANEGRFMSGSPKVPFKSPTIVSAQNKNKDPMQRVKELAKAAAKRQAGIKEDMEPEDSQEKTNTPAERSLTKTAGMVKDLANQAKEKNKKEKPEVFQPEPELSSQIVKV